MSPSSVPRCDHPTPAFTIATTPQGRFFYVYEKLIAYQGRGMSVRVSDIEGEVDGPETISVRIEGMAIYRGVELGLAEMACQGFPVVSPQAFAAIIGFDGDPRLLTGDFR